VTPPGCGSAARAKRLAGSRVGKSRRWRTRLKAKVAKRRGRPPAGLAGKPSSKYPQLSVRVPPKTIRQCVALAVSMGLPQWQIVRNAVDLYHGTLRHPKSN
jgi:hypothetical protein